jgi:hypothetical protein
MKQRNDRLFRNPIVGVGAAVCALACGGGNDGSASNQKESSAVEPSSPAPASLPSRAADLTCASNPLLAGCPPMPAPAPAAPAAPTAAVAPPPAAADCTPTAAGLLDFDDLFQTVSLDLAKADNADAPFYRYISLSDRLQSGACWQDQIGRNRQGLLKMLNMLSISTTLAEVVPVDRENLVYRIDLRDFEWNRAIAVNGLNFDDVWEAIAASNPYAVVFAGDDADDAKADSTTDFPLMFADQMADVATFGNLYYAIVDVDVTQTLANFIANDLGINEVQDVIDGDVIRAGTTQSRVSRQDRLVERHDIGVRSGFYWQSFDFEDAAGNDSIFDDPFGFQAGAREAIFTLPNGMLGFIIADAADAIVEDTDILLDATRDDLRSVTAVSCSNCHAQGLLPVVDEVGARALANARTLGLNQDEILGLQYEYVAPEVFAKVAKDDSAAFYQTALLRLQVATEGTDPVAEAVLHFDDDVTLTTAAGDLGLTPEDLVSNLNLLDPALAVLRQGTLDRDDFTQVYVASLCALSTPLDNQPDAAVCAQALAALGN